MKKQALGLIFLLLVVGVSAGLCRAQDWPLTQDDIKILLIGGAKPEKMIQMIQQRGVDFQMNPDLAKKFHDLGASDEVIKAIQHATVKTSRKPAATTAPTAASMPSAPAKAPAGQPSSAADSEDQSSGSVQEKISSALSQKTAVVDETDSGDSDTPPEAGSPKTAAKKTKPVAAPVLKDPSPAEIQHIIREFAAKEKLFKQARDNYTYHQINKVQDLGPNNEVLGTYRQDWDILFDKTGKRIEQVTYAPPSTLKNFSVTEQDLDAMRNIQPFVLTTDDLPEYDIKYLGHVKVDYITTYVFHVRPKEIKKGKQYFDGIVWVDDRDLQIVKSEGKNVPELKTKHGENLFPRFTTYREQIDGKFWFPTFTMADDTLYFPGNPAHIKEVIRYTNYKQYKASSTIKVLGEVSSDNDKSNPASKPKPNPPKQ